MIEFLLESLCLRLFRLINHCVRQKPYMKFMSDGYYYNTRMYNKFRALTQHTCANVAGQNTVQILVLDILIPNT